MGDPNRQIHAAQLMPKLHFLMQNPLPAQDSNIYRKIDSHQRELQ